MNRRDFICSGLIGGLGLTTGDILKLQAQSEKQAVAQSIIHIYLPGGAAAQEMWDPHPLAPSEYRGPLQVINTVLPGVQFSEHFKKTAKIADKITVVRSMTHTEAAHERGTSSMFTGYRPSPAVNYPSFGSIVAHQFGNRNNIPAYICVPQKLDNNGNDVAGTGYLSNAFGPFSLGSDPSSPSFKVRDLQSTVSDDRFDRRRSILDTVDSHFKYLEKSDSLASMDTFYQQAYDLIASPKARDAFSINQEPQVMREAYGMTPAGQRLLMARRLVEAGSRFVTVTYGGWDMHTNIGSGIANQLPTFDQAYAALITDLDQRGMLDTTLVMVSSEFGRTPKINKDGGRDHWPRVFSIALAGGGIKKGFVYGSSDATGSDVESNPLTVENLAATIYNQIGIDPDSKLSTSDGRPVAVVYNGTVVKDLLV